MEHDASWKPRLEEILAKFGCQTGTLHRTMPDGETLELVCQIGVPESLMDKISAIPFGKGIAGAAAERREAVELCNLQQDLGGVAKPDARQTGVAGSLAVPVFAGRNPAEVIGTLGIGKFPFPTSSPSRKNRRLAEHAARNRRRLFEEQTPGELVDHRRDVTRLAP
jgi:L-methionine (R)-S-oxide reductase